MKKQAHLEFIFVNPFTNFVKYAIMITNRKDFEMDNTNNERIDLKAGTLLSPLPAVIVTVGDMEKANALTVAWTGI